MFVVHRTWLNGSIEVARKQSSIKKSSAKKAQKKSEGKSE